jgi:hypothetical protein
MGSLEEAAFGGEWVTSDRHGVQSPVKKNEEDQGAKIRTCSGTGGHGTDMGNREER